MNQLLWVCLCLAPLTSFADNNPCETYLEQTLGAKGSLVSAPVQIKLNSPLLVPSESEKLIKKHKTGFRQETLYWSDANAPENAKPAHAILVYRDHDNRISELVYENETMNRNAGEKPTLLRSVIDLRYEKDSGQCALNSHHEVWLKRDPQGKSVTEDIYPPALKICRNIANGVRRGDFKLVDQEINRYQKSVRAFQRPEDIRQLGAADPNSEAHQKVVQSYVDLCQKDSQYGLFLNAPEKK